MFSSCIWTQNQYLQGLNWYSIGEGRNADLLADILGCKMASIPIKLLGLLLGEKSKDVSVWNLIMNRFESSLVGWRRSYLSKGGRLTLTKRTTVNLTIYYLSLLPILVSVVKRLGPIEKAFCGGIGWGKKIPLVAWEVSRSIHLMSWKKHYKDDEW